MSQSPELPDKMDVTETLESARIILERSITSPFIWNNQFMGESTLTHFIGNPVVLRVLDDLSALESGVAVEWQLTQRDYEDGDNYCHLTYVFGFDGTESMIIRRNNDPHDVVTGLDLRVDDKRIAIDRNDTESKVYSLRNLLRFAF